VVAVAVGPGDTGMAVAGAVEVGATVTVGQEVADGEATGDGSDGVGLAAGLGGACFAKQPTVPVIEISSEVAARMAGPELNRISSRYLQPGRLEPRLFSAIAGLITRTFVLS
jgi:hypothetical protein